MRILTSVLCLSLLSCVDASDKDVVNYFNTPPNIRIDEPVDDSSYVQFEDVLFVIYVEDNQDPAEALTLEWSSDIQGKLMGPTTPSEDGTAFYPTANLDGGYHTILITVTDTEGLSSAQSIHVDIEGQSGMELLSPEEDEYGRIDEETEFSVIIRDGIDAIEDLDIDFSSSHSAILGSFCTPEIDPEEKIASCSRAMEEGIHTITFSAINSLEEETNLEITFPVYRPEQIDDDGDGFCEEPPCINVEYEILDTGLDSGSPDTGTTDPLYLVDCDDSDANVAPNKLDIFNGIDDNCNGLTDEGDDDGDGYCEVLPCLTSITEVAPDANDEGMEDCDDSKDYVYPGATEIPNQEDDDCDGIPDEETDLYDDDGDGFSENQGDCNDDPLLGAAIFPESPEQLNQIDDDCDGIIDDETVLFDDDGDGYCESPPCIGSSAVTGLEPDSDTIADCDDNRVETYPHAEEVPNDIDENCNGIIDEQTIVYDDDGDGYCESPPCTGSIDTLQSDADTKNDCNDGEISIYLGAPESANGVDENCDGIVDEGTEVYDDDGDGYCESPPCIESITTLADDADNIIDCLDSNDTVYTGAPETPNNLDDNCDGIADNSTVIYDDDGDGYCESPPCVGSVSELQSDAGYRTDCNDAAINIYLGAPENPDGIDEDCDGTIDEGTGIFDDDGDGYCETPPCTGSIDTIYEDADEKPDCDDGNDTIFFGATETANGIDDDCDNTIDDNTVAFDDDGDGYCESPPCVGSISELQSDASYRTDCNDAAINIYLGAPENPDGIDEDCDGTIDEGTGVFDDDGDGYCESPPCTGSIDTIYENSATMPDCDDSNNTIFLGAPETANGIDDDCDTTIDNNTVAFDDDGDGYCESPPCVGSISELQSDAGYITDCDDNAINIYLGAPENPDGVDEDCDGTIDEGTGVFDDDGDGYCESPPCTGSIDTIYENSGTMPDCDDGNDTIFLGAPETANGIDDDCDNTIDDNTVVFDDDGDGYCESPPCVGSITSLGNGHNSRNDCNDAVITTYLGAPETVNGVDDDCDSVIDDGTVAFDDDGDGYCESPPCVGSISSLEYNSSSHSDCNDGNDTIHYGSIEVANGVDEDCDGTIDEGTVNYDDDGDGYSEQDGDCDDTTTARSPGLPEKCTTNFDDNCNSDTNDINAQGCTTYYYDSDNDGYGTSSTQCSCDPIDNYRATAAGDCEDSNSNVRPNQTQYFGSPYNSSSYDYNCANGNEKEDTSSGSCKHSVSTGQWCTRENTGWSGSAPSCGQSGGYIDDNNDCSCKNNWLGICTSCRKTPNSNKTQKCR